MTKTITELQPMIYGDLFALTWKRKQQKRRFTGIARRVLAPLYVVLGLMIVFDAGALPWDYRFWMMFLPFFALGEMGMATLSQQDSRFRRAASEASEATSLFRAIESTTVCSNPKKSTLIDPVMKRLVEDGASGQRERQNAPVLVES